MRAFVVTFALSLGLHVLAFSVIAKGEAPMTAGGGQAATLRLGNSFEDVAAGSAAIPVTPASASPTAARDVAPQATPTVSLTPAATRTVPTPVVAADPTPAEFAPIVPEAKPEPSPAAAERAGQADGQVNGESQRKSDAPSAGDGTAKVSNYPGLVMKKLKKTRKDRVSARGTALVGFIIAADGSLDSASIVKSSGSDAIDKAALALVARAAPFPPPPKGAERRFSFEFSGG